MVLEMAADKSISEYLAEIGRKGGKAQVPKGTAMLSEEERRAIAMKGVAARKKKATAAKKAARKAK
jgi:hypothetical protein